MTNTTTMMTTGPNAGGNAPQLRLTPLGGVGRFGRNCLLVEDGASGAAIVIDCGVRFAGPELPGFDAGLPDLERLASVGDRLLAYVITHGHEDHIGALPFALRERPAKVVCTSFSRHFVQRRCERHGVKVDLDVVDYGVERAVGPFGVTLAAVSHSIPGAASVVLRTPVGLVVHSGDFRVDDDPVFGPPTDLVTLTRAGDQGVACLLADSTGAALPGKNAGERAVAAGLDACFVDVAGAPLRGALFVTLFASHLQRLALLVEACRRHGRRLVPVGRGLKEAMRMALAEGALQGDDVWIDESAARALPRHLVCVALTGSQGEPQAALARLARALSTTDAAGAGGGGGGVGYPAQRGDRVVWSARVIPGNELSVQPLVDAFADGGVDVVAGRRAPHVSGHGHEEDLRLLLAATRPRAFVALHGNPEHLVAHGALAAGLGIAPRGIVGLRDGHTLVLQRDDDDVRLAHVAGERAQEPAAQGGDVAWFPRGIALARARMGTGGVVVVVVDHEGVVAAHGRGVFPALDDDPLWVRARGALHEAVRARGSVDDETVRAVARLYRRADRAAPELVVVSEPRLTSPSGLE
ncbi:MAG: ribonuclease J [Deltaproteobacteria bacterium]|nr:ribonuclease J [Deltaproteobacteria bacterium]